jgi:hypothetical protein
MFIHPSAPSYIRPMISSPVRRPLWQKAIGLLGPKVMMWAEGKILVIFCLSLLLANAWLSSSASRIALTVLEAEEGRTALVDENITLRAERAHLVSPEYLEKTAAHRFALYVPEKKQVFRF